MTADVVFTVVGTAIPATIAAFAAWRKASNSEQQTRKVKELVSTPNGETLGQLVAANYDNVNNLARLVVTHIGDDRLHPALCKEKP